MRDRGGDDIDHIHCVDQFIDAVKMPDPEFLLDLGRGFYICVVKAGKFILSYFPDTFYMYFTKVTGSQNPNFNHLSEFCANVVFLGKLIYYFRHLKSTVYCNIIRMLQDTYRHKGLRKKLVDSLREKGIRDEQVLKAMERVPRHLFLDSSFLEFAYQDKAFPIGSGQTISQPYTVAFQTQLLNVRPGDKILEIGTGSGYQSCVLIEMGAKVYTIERQKKLFEKTRDFLPTIGYNPKMFYGDGYKGLPSFSPFDKIIITAAAPEIPGELIRQMKTGGILIIPMGPPEVQTMFTVEKISESETKLTEHEQFRFVPMLGNKAKD